MINLYLDKNYLQNFTNLDKSNNAGFKKLLKRLLVLQKDHKIRILRSSIHEIECGTDPFDHSTRAILNRKILHETLVKIGSVRLIDYQEIRDLQFTGYLFKFLGINKCFDFSNIEIIDKYQGFDYHPWWFKNPYSEDKAWFNSASFNALNERIKNGKMNASEWYKEELESMRQDFLTRYRAGQDYFSILKDTLSIDEAQIKRFLESKHFVDIPFVNIFCKLSAKFSSQKQKAYRNDLNHDLFDTITASAYLPYCDVFCTDHEVKTYIKEGKFNYQARLYSAKKDDVGAVLSFFEKMVE